MKKRILTIATMLFLAIMIPMTVNAATISAEPTEMKVGDIVTVTVEIDTADVEAVQFDLDFDAAKYQYVLGSAESELDSTESNLLDNDTVRVSAFNFNTNETIHKVTLKFKAINAGSSVPFKVVDGTLEATDATGTTTMETFANANAIVSKIEGLPVPDQKDPEYFDENGNPITKHKNTGDSIRATTTKSIAGVYTKLIQGKLVVPYALPTSDDILTIEDIKAEFGSNVDVTGLTNPVKSGDTFILNGQQHTVLIYGDVNKDGKVTTADALIIRKYEQNILTSDEVTAITSEVANSLENSKAVQQFVLRLRQTSTKTILDVYPVEFVASDISVTPNSTSILRGEKTLIATVSIKDGRTITSNLLEKINIPNVVIETVEENGQIKIFATPSNSTAFNITPVISGNNIENGKIAATPQNVTINEVGTVTDIRFFDQKGNEIKDELRMLSGEITKLVIKYYHTYPDGTTVELTDENTSKDFFNTNRVKFKRTADKSILHSQTGLYDNIDNMSSSGLTSRYAMHIGSFLDRIGTETLTVTVENNDSKYLNTQNYQRTFEKTFDVVVYNEIATQLKIDGQIKNDGDSIDLNIYKVAQTNNDKVIMHQSSQASFETPYTLIDVSLITNGTVGTKPLTLETCGIGTTEDHGKMNSIESLVIAENNNPTDSWELDIEYFKKIDGKYVKIDENTTAIDYIGISYYADDGWDTCIEPLEEGLTIYFGGTVNSDGTVTKKHINVNVTGIETDLGAPTNAPSKPVAPSEDELPVESTTPSVEPTETVSPNPTTSVTPSTSPEATDEPNDFDDPFDAGSDFQDVVITPTPSTSSETTPTESPKADDIEITE